MCVFRFQFPIDFFHLLNDTGLKCYVGFSMNLGRVLVGGTSEEWDRSHFHLVYIFCVAFSENEKYSRARAYLTPVLANHPTIAHSTDDWDWKTSSRDFVPTVSLARKSPTREKSWLANATLCQILRDTFRGKKFHSYCHTHIDPSISFIITKSVGWKDLINSHTSIQKLHKSDFLLIYRFKIGDWWYYNIIYLYL